MKICVLNNYIVGYSVTKGQEVSEKEWGSIRVALNNRPEPDEGYQMMLRFDNLAWESVKLPDTQEEYHEPSAEELLNIIIGGEYE